MTHLNGVLKDSVLQEKESQKDSPGERSLTKLGDVIDMLFGGGVIPLSREDFRIWDVWGEAVGPVISENTRPCWIKNGVLRVLVSDSMWLHELKYQEQTIREQLNSLLGRVAVSRIDFKASLR